MSHPGRGDREGVYVRPTRVSTKSRPKLEVLSASTWGRRLRAVGTVTATVELLNRGADIQEEFDATTAKELRQIATMVLDYAERMTAAAIRDDAKGGSGGR